MSLSPDLEALRSALLSLTPAQQIAVEALSTGATHHIAAKKAGVTRETVTRWAGHLPAFQATLNLYRATIIADQIDTARRIRGKALDAVESAVDNGTIDPLAVLRVISDAQMVGPTVPEAILDAEMNRTREGLPPTAPPRGLDAELAMLHNPPPSNVELAETFTIARLAASARLSGT